MGTDNSRTEQIIRELGDGTPHNFTVVEQLFKEIQAVVVLLTPDEDAYLRDFLRKGDDSPYEATLTGQPRQNVLIEAGMAFALHRKETILVEVGHVRSASDFQGMNVVRIAGTPKSIRTSLHRFASRLTNAGCDIDQVGERSQETGRFEDVVRQLDREDKTPSNPLLRLGLRGETLADAVVNIGLMDIENRDDKDRDDKDRALPPKSFYDLAKRQVMITGISAARTFDYNAKDIHEMLNRHIEVCVLILPPENCPDIEMLKLRERRDIPGDIRGVFEVIKAEKLLDRRGFQIRFMHRLPSFTAVMIDGDVDPLGNKPADSGGQIRVQPTTIFKTHHEGPVLTFKKKPRKGGIPAGVFDFFAEEVRKQWQYASRDPIPIP